MMQKLPTVAILSLKDNKLLLTYSNNKKAWYLPGGKIDNNENKVTALKREIEEELNVKINEKLLEYYTHISAKAYGENNLMMEQDCYFYPINEEIKVSNEILEAKYFSYQEYLKLQKQVEGVLIVFKKLILDNYLTL